MAATIIRAAYLVPILKSSRLPLTGPATTIPRLSLALKSSLMIRTTGSIILFAAFVAAAFAQPEVMAWGNLTGLRVDGHLLELATSMCVAQPELAGVSCTGREKQQNSYSRSGKIETVTIQMRPAREFRDPQRAGWVMAATEVVEDTGPATARIDLEFTSPNEADIGGAFLGIELPAPVFSGGSVELVGPDPTTAARTSLAAGPADQNEYLRATATGALHIPHPPDRGDVQRADPDHRPR